MRIRQLLLIVAVVGVSVAVGLGQDATSFRTLYSFTGQPDGGNPQGGVVIGAGGVLYGTTISGGTSNLGTVLSLTPPVSTGGRWTEAVMHDFAGGSGDGANPYAGVVIGRNGELYGTTKSGGTSNYGTVFKLTPPAAEGGAWIQTVLHDFPGGSGGAYPTAGVVIGKGGVLYGTTIEGTGCSSIRGGCGTVFKLAPPTTPGGAWTETVLHSFLGVPSDGTDPIAGVLIGSGGVLYGTTHLGGTGPCTFGRAYLGCGTVFQLGGRTETVLYNFTGSSDESPLAGLVIGSGGVLYGTASSCLNPPPTECGSNAGGEVFSLTPPAFAGGAWTETVLHPFVGGSGDGANPTAGLLIGSGGVLYGTTSSGGASNAGTVFSLTPPTSPEGAWTETVLHSFTGGLDGALPLAGLAIGTNGTLYGTTSTGGASGNGPVFALKP